MISHRFYKLAGLLTFLLLCRPALSTSINPGSSPGIPDISSITTSVTAPDSTSNVTFSIDGFEVQHLYDVPLEQQGSWVSLTTLPDGSLIASEDRKSTRLNSSHVAISYAVFCLKKKKT